MPQPSNFRATYDMQVRVAFNMAFAKSLAAFFADALPRQTEKF